MWRVFSCKGSARNDVVIHAMLMAYDAGVDIISMSLGSGLPWSSPKDVQSKVLSKISASGVSGKFLRLVNNKNCYTATLTLLFIYLVVLSAGNNGAKGAFTTGAPGNVISAFEVASINNEYVPVDESLTATGLPDPIGKQA
jgi:hypothetical protein